MNKRKAIALMRDEMNAALKEIDRMLPEIQHYREGYADLTNDEITDITLTETEKFRRLVHTLWCYCTGNDFIPTRPR